VPALLRGGGYIPAIDHLVPPAVLYASMRAKAQLGWREQASFR
jgi:hypothetical protein